MPLAPPTFAGAHAVLGFPSTLPSRGDLDEKFIRAVESQFPTVIARQPPLTDVYQNVPRLVLASTSSQIALSGAQADFEVRFYGDYATDAGLCLDYIHQK